MQTTSALWKAYQALPAKKYEYKVVIGTDEYYASDIFSMGAELQLCDDSTFALGNVFARKLNLSVKQKATAIPKMASVAVYVRMTGSSGPTEWLPKGKFNIDTRKKSGLATMMECYDKVLMMEEPFIQDGVSAEYPMLMTDAIDVVCTRLGITFINPGAIQATFSIEYPNDLTMREVMGYIADANGGNFILNDEGNLQLVIPVNGTSVATASYRALTDDNDAQTFDKVTMYYDDTNGFESGTGDNEFVDSNIWATQTIADYVLTVLDGYTHKPFTCSGAYVDPAIELGDTLTINGVNYVLFNASITYGANIVMDISAPGETELAHEYPYTGSYAKAIKNKVTLGSPYYGVNISRANGLQITGTGSGNQTTINSDIWQVLVNNIAKLFVDWNTNEMYYGGKLTVEALEAVKAEIAVVVSNTVIVNNLYAQYGRIANLTVNELNTSYKMITNYLLKDTDFEASIADVVYRGIYDDRNEIWVCTTDGTEDEQVLGADDAPLYWIDATKTQIHTDVTAYPVMRWVYDYVLKYEQGTELVDGVYLPYTIEGVGDGVTAMSGRLKTQKLSDGWHVTYYQRTTGVEIGFTVTDDGVKVLAPELNALTLKNCIISNQDPTVELLPVGDIWFKYT